MKNFMWITYAKEIMLRSCRKNNFSKQIYFNETLILPCGKPLAEDIVTLYNRIQRNSREHSRFHRIDKKLGRQR